MGSSGGREVKLDLRDTAIFLVTTGLSIFGLVFGGYELLWDLLSVPEDVRAGLTLALSVAIILIGFWGAALLRENAHSKFVESKIESFGQTLNSSLGGVSGLRVCQTSDDALAHLMGQIRRARKVWNTRVPSPGFGDYPAGVAKDYEKLVAERVKAGLHLSEIVGEVFEERAKKLKAETAEKKNYDFIVAVGPNAPFFNFIVIEDESGVREVMFGWVITPNRGFEQECFISHNQKLIDMFIALHAYMMSGQGVVRK